MILRKPADPAEDDFGSAYFVDMFFRKRGSDPLHSDPSFLDRITMNNNSIGDGGFLFALKFASQLPDLKTLELTNNGIKVGVLLVPAFTRAYYCSWSLARRRWTESCHTSRSHR